MMIINDYDTGLHIDPTMLLMVILGCILSTYKKNVYSKIVCRVTLATASYVSCLPCVLIASFSLELDLILQCFVNLV